MKAMILAAGLGSRLGALTADTPKCLMKIGEKTILEYVVENLKKAGVNSIVINLHYLAPVVKEFIHKKNSFDIEILFTYEAELLGTGGGVKNARHFMDNEELFLVHNADVYTTLDLASMVNAHRECESLVTLGVMDRSTSRPLIFDADNQLAGWKSIENNVGDAIADAGAVFPLAFSGIQVLSPGIFKYMETQSGAFSIIRTYMHAARASERIRAYRMDSAYWIDIGKPNQLEELRSRIANL